ncbi:hypothetical protein ACFLR4_04415 [Bacteroidota bacterium]
MFGRPLIIFLLGIISIAVVSFNNIFRRSNEINDNMIEYFLTETANNISQTGINMALRELETDTTWRAGFNLEDTFGGKLRVRLVDTMYNLIRVIKVESVGITNYGFDNEEVSLSIVYYDPWAFGFLPPNVLAAITTNNDVQTLGTLVVDGRNYDIDAISVPNTGTYAIWTTNNLERKGASELGSTESGIDNEPAKVEDETVRLENQTYPGGLGFPSTPDLVMGGPAEGYSPGTLKSIALSGEGGSQYVTNPSSLTLPLSGVTFVELPSGDSWIDADISGSGVLIVHNSDNNAILKNLYGNFKGLLIIDDLIHIHATILGAVIALTPSPSDGNCIGNGEGTILFSREAIKRGSAATVIEPSVSKSAEKVVAWWD